MRNRKLHVVVIGLGQFGSELARTLSDRAEVLALDIDESRVTEVADKVQKAGVLDARDTVALGSVVSSDFDEAVVSMGESLESSILCTLHLRKIGIPVIRAKAESDDHAEVLTAVGATHVIFPERDTAQRIGAQILNPNLLDFIPLVEDYRVIEEAAPESFHHRTLGELGLRQRLGLFVLAAREGPTGELAFLPGPGFSIQPRHRLLIIGREQNLVRLQDLEDGKGKKVRS
jgi:trk system potassium uptake protein TrkA